MALVVPDSLQEYWSVLPCPSPRDFPNPGIEPGSPALQADSLPLSHQFSSVQFSHSVVSDSFATLWTVAHQGPLAMGFPRQGYWGGLQFFSPGDFPNPGIEPRSLALQADS